MNDAQLAVARDELIALVDEGPSPLAVKFQPALQDRVNGKESSAAELDKIKTEVLTIILASHEIAISALRRELADDPDSVGYAGQPPEVIQGLLTEERPVFVDVPVAHGFEDKVAAIVSSMVPDAKAPVSEPVMVKQLVMVKAPPVSVIWRGIPYCRNLPSIDNINEALA